MTRSFKSFVWLFTVLLLVPALPARAKPLTKKECTSLVAEHTQLSSKNIEKLMDRDPAEAKEKLKPDELAAIERFLFVEGQIRFRCPAVKFVVPPPPPPEPEIRQATNQSGEEKDKPGTAKKNRPAEKGPRVPFPDRNPKRR